MQVKIVETKKADRDLNKAPTEVLKSYQLWCSFIKDQGIDYISSINKRRHMLKKKAKSSEKNQTSVHAVP